jgi:hypothetical protein
VGKRQQRFLTLHDIAPLYLDSSAHATAKILMMWGCIIHRVYRCLQMPVEPAGLSQNIPAQQTSSPGFPQRTFSPAQAESMSRRGVMRFSPWATDMRAATWVLVGASDAMDGTGHKAVPTARTQTRRRVIDALSQGLTKQERRYDDAPATKSQRSPAVERYDRSEVTSGNALTEHMFSGFGQRDVIQASYAAGRDGALRTLRR